MSFNLKGRSYLKLDGFTQREMLYLLDLSRDLKRAKYAGTERELLRGKEICLIFEKTSTRTRCAFEVAAHDQGAHVTYLDPAGSQIGHKESMKDTARVLGRMFDAIEFRGSGQSAVEDLAKYAGVPVYNGLTDDWHPTQMLADMLTMVENCDKPRTQIAYAFLGDARNNMGNSLLVLGAMMGCGDKWRRVVPSPLPKRIFQLRPIKWLLEKDRWGRRSRRRRTSPAPPAAGRSSAPSRTCPRRCAARGIFILFAVGALIGTWALSGTLVAMVYYGLQLLSPNYFYATACAAAR
jgi:hypothetical protein